MPTPLALLLDLLLAFYFGGCTLMVAGALMMRESIRAQAEAAGTDPGVFAVGVVLGWPIWCFRALRQGATISAPNAAAERSRRDAIEALQGASKATKESHTHHVEAQAMLRQTIRLREETLAAEQRIRSLVLAQDLTGAATAVVDHSLLATVLEHEVWLRGLVRALDRNDPDASRAILEEVRRMLPPEGTTTAAEDLAAAEAL